MPKASAILATRRITVKNYYLHCRVLCPTSYGFLAIRLVGIMAPAGHTSRQR